MWWASTPTSTSGAGSSAKFEAIAYYEGASFNASDGSNALRLEGAQVTHDFAAVLGVKPILGRFFTSEGFVPKGPQVVVISYGLWQDRFGGERDVLGKALRLDGIARTVIGVMPRGVDFPGGVRFYVPLAADYRNDGQSYSGNGIGRLKAGVTAAQGRARPAAHAAADLGRARQGEGRLALRGPVARGAGARLPHERPRAGRGPSGCCWWWRAPTSRA